MEMSNSQHRKFKTLQQRLQRLMLTINQIVAKIDKAEVGAVDRVARGALRMAEKQEAEQEQVCTGTSALASQATE